MDKKSIILALDKALRAEGYHRRRQSHPYLCDFGKSVLGWVGMNVESKKRLGRFSIDAYVGAHYPEIERLFYELTDGPPSGVPTATVANYLGNLTGAPDLSGYKLNLEESPEPIVEAVVSDIQKFGMPWMKSMLDTEELERMIVKLNFPDYAAYRLPLLYWLDGRPELIERTFSRYVESRGNMDWFRERYTKFQERLRALMQTSA